MSCQYWRDYVLSVSAPGVTLCAHCAAATAPAAAVACDFRDALEAERAVFEARKRAQREAIMYLRWANSETAACRRWGKACWGNAE